MEEKQIPYAWIGQDLILCRAGAENWELVTVREVNELGVAYAYKSGEVAGETVFVPWSSVRAGCGLPYPAIWRRQRPNDPARVT